MKTMKEIMQILSQIRKHKNLRKVENTFGITGMQLNFLLAVIAVGRYNEGQNNKKTKNYDKGTAI